MSGWSTLNGVNLPIGPLAGTINHGLFVWLGGLVLLGQGHQYLWKHKRNKKKKEEMQKEKKKNSK